ncbi:MAG: sodium:solute symporter family protein, partial [Desulfovibrio sp.]|nr:sodium:solute symporter family protein [Desulfovibrio sp.]
MNIYIVVLILFMLLLLSVGHMASRRKKETVSDYFVAGRSMGVIVIAGVYGGSFLSAGSFVGTIGFNYAYGWSATWQLLGTLTCLFVLAAFFAKKFWRFGYYNDAVTMPDLIGLRYPSKWSRGLYSVIILVIYTIGLAAMYMGIYTVLSQVSELSYMTCIIIGASVVFIYTFSGGARAVAWTDTVCMFLMVGAMVVLIPTILIKAGGFEALITKLGTAVTPEGKPWQQGAALLSGTNSFLTASVSFGWFLIWACGNLCQPHQLTRIYLAKNEKVARGAVALCMIPFMLIYLAGLLVASYARNRFPDLPRIDAAFPAVAMDIFPPAFAAVILMAIIAAIMSTAATMLLITSQCTSYDIYKKLIKPDAGEKSILAISRGTMLVCSILSVVIAYFAQTITGLIFLWSAAFAMMGAGILPSLISAFFW